METIIETVAKIIDPAAFEECIQLPEETDLDRSRRKYLQGKAMLKAENILKLAATTPNLRAELAKAETEGWRRLGLPDSVLHSMEIQRIIAGKYGVPV